MAVVSPVIEVLDTPLLTGDPFLEEYLPESQRPHVARTRSVISREIDRVLYHIELAEKLTEGIYPGTRANFNLADMRELVEQVKNASYRLEVLRHNIISQPGLYSVSKDLLLHLLEDSLLFSKTLKAGIRLFDRALRDPLPGVNEINEVLNIASELFKRLDFASSALIHFRIEYRPQTD